MRLAGKRLPRCLVDVATRAVSADDGIDRLAAELTIDPERIAALKELCEMIAAVPFGEAAFVHE